MTCSGPDLDPIWDPPGGRNVSKIYNCRQILAFRHLRPEGASGVHLGPFWGVPGASWEPLGGVLGASWGVLGASWGVLGASWAS